MAAPFPKLPWRCPRRRSRLTTLLIKLLHGALQRRGLIAAGLTFSAHIAEILLLSFLSTVLKAFWGLSDEEAATIFSSVLIGQVVGTLSLGPLADRFGRRPIFLITSVMIGIFGFATAGANSYTVLIVLRILVGYSLGAVTTPYDLLAEVTTKRDSRSRSKCGTVLLGWRPAADHIACVSLPGSPGISHDKPKRLATICGSCVCSGCHFL